MATAQKTVVIVQANYLPWRGYFDILRQAGELIPLDSVKYTRRDWRNRNLIRTSAGTQWLTVPVQVKGRFEQSIDETTTLASEWAATHIRAIELNYRKAAAFAEAARCLRAAAAIPSLSGLNELLILGVAERLSIATPIRCFYRHVSFETLLGIASHRGPVSYWDITGRENPRKGETAVRKTPRRRKTAAGMRQDGPLKAGNPTSIQPIGPAQGL